MFGEELFRALKTLPQKMERNKLIDWYLQWLRETKGISESYGKYARVTVQELIVYANQCGIKVTI